MKHDKPWRSTSSDVASWGCGLHSPGKSCSIPGFRNVILMLKKSMVYMSSPCAKTRCTWNHALSIPQSALLGDVLRDADTTLLVKHGYRLCSIQVHPTSSAYLLWVTPSKQWSNNTQKPSVRPLAGTFTHTTGTLPPHPRTRRHGATTPTPKKACSNDTQNGMWEKDFANRYSPLSTWSKNPLLAKLSGKYYTLHKAEGRTTHPSG